MKTQAFKNILAVSAVLASTLGVLGVGTAKAVTFELVATCDFCTTPLVPGSPVTGALTLDDSILVGGAVPLGGPIFTADIVSLTLTFITDTPPDFLLAYDFGPSFEPLPGVTEPVGAFNAAGTGIDFITFTDSTANPVQLFDISAIAEGQPLIWTLIDVPGGAGEVISFETLVEEVPEPNSALPFILAISLMGFQARRRLIEAMAR